MVKDLSARFYLVGVCMVSWSLLTVHPTGAFADQDSVTLQNDMWSIQLELPAYELWDDHPLRGQPNFVFAATSSGGSCSLNLSMFAISVPDGTSAHQCRKGFMGNPEPLAKQREVVLHDHQVSPVTYTLYDIALGSGKGAIGVLRQNKLYGYWSLKDVCFELHISSVNCEEFKTHALPILETVKIDEDSGATIETVALAQESGRHPKDWSVHLAAASAYLHRVEPSVPTRARRFYLSALALGDDIDDRTRWVIEEGIGISWLMEDRGQEAIPHLSRALAIGRRIPDKDKMLSSTLYNISCAYGLVDDVQQACKYLEELISSQTRQDAKITLKVIKKDKQLRRVRKSQCYKELRAQAR